MKRKPELLLPVGGKEQLKAAVENGADALYLGGSVFNARQHAENFNSEELKQAIEYAHVRDVNVYLTMNTLLHDRELEKAMENLVEAYKFGIDGVIIQDLGFASLVKKNLPELPMHLSTQATVYNAEGVKKAEELGFKRVVLARELSLKEIEKISQNTHAELEVFIHGALCISYSGQCLMSSFIGGRSGNRGTCAQPCRLNYQLLRKSQEELIKVGAPDYLISPKDLCGVDYLQQLMDLNITSLKIEGRMKSAEYVAQVTQTYRQYLDKRFRDDQEEVDNNSKKNLAQIYNRGGFSEGYLDPYRLKTQGSFVTKASPKHTGILIGRVIRYNPQKNELNLELEGRLAIGDIIEVLSDEFAGGRVTYMESIKHQSISVADNKDVVFVQSMKGKFVSGEKVYKIVDLQLNKELQKTYSKENLRKAEVEGRFIAKEGEPLKFEVWDKKNRVEMISDYSPEKAIHQETSQETILKQLCKTGSTPFVFKNCQIDSQDFLSMKASEINDIRRKALERLEEIKKDKYPERHNKAIDIAWPQVENAIKKVKKPKVSLFMWHFIKGVETLDVDRLYISLTDIFNKDFQENIQGIKDSVEIVLWIPGLTRGHYDDYIKEKIKDISRLNIHGIMVGNLGHIAMLEDLGIPLYGDTSFNVFNAYTLKQLKEMGLKGTALSNELNLEDIQDLVQDDFELEAAVYGQLPMMTMEYCPIGKRIRKDETQECRLCINNDYYLLDRMDKQLPLITDRMDCRVTLLNGDKIDVPDMLQPLRERGVSLFRFYFYNESLEEMGNIIRDYRKAFHVENKGYKREKGLTAGHYKRGV